MSRPRTHSTTPRCVPEPLARIDSLAESAATERRPAGRRACSEVRFGLGLGVVLAEELRRLGRALRKPGFLKDRRDIGV